MSAPKKKSVRELMNDHKAASNKRFDKKTGITVKKGQKKEDIKLYWNDIKLHCDKLLTNVDAVNTEVEKMVNAKGIEEASSKKPEVKEHLDNLVNHYRRDLLATVREVEKIADAVKDFKGEVIDRGDLEVFNELFHSIVTVSTNFAVLTQPTISSISLLLTTLADDSVTDEEVKETIETTDYASIKKEMEDESTSTKLSKLISDEMKDGKSDKLKVATFDKDKGVN